MSSRCVSVFDIDEEQDIHVPAASASRSAPSSPLPVQPGSLSTLEFACEMPAAAQPTSAQSADMALREERIRRTIREREERIRRAVEGNGAAETEKSAAENEKREHMLEEQAVDASPDPEREAADEKEALRRSQASVNLAAVLAAHESAAARAAEKALWAAQRARQRGGSGRAGS